MNNKYVPEFFMWIKKEKRKTYVAAVVAVCCTVLAGGFYMKECTSVGNSVSGKEMPVCSVDTEKNQVALTFETAWGEEKTKQVLDILKKEKIKSTFFITGEWAEKHSEVLLRMKREGHDIGNSGQTHENLVQKKQREQKQEIQSAQRIVKEQTGKEMTLFRPPYGKYNNSLLRTAQSLGYLSVTWSIDSKDWKEYGEKEIIDAVINSGDLKKGAIIRLNSEGKDTPKALPKLIREIKKRGYQIVPVSQMAYKENYYMDINGRQIPRLT